MAEQLDYLYIAHVTPGERESAYRLHERMATTPDSHLWARTEAEIKTLIDEYSLFGAWVGSDKRLVAICYVTLSDNELSWEIGGMTVDDSVRGLGIGTILFRFVLAHTIVYQEPWVNGQKLLVHIHEGNREPRVLIERLGFQYIKTFEVPESSNPPKWMKRNAQGRVMGEEFEFSAAASKALSDWFYDDLDQLMKQGKLEFGLGDAYRLNDYEYSLDDFKADLREITKDVLKLTSPADTDLSN